MSYKDVLDMASSWEAIVAAAIGAAAYGKSKWSQRSRMQALEAYLREEKSRGFDQGQRSVIHLMGNLAMTEADILKAGFQSKKIKSVPKSGDQGFADGLLFEYVGSDVLAPQKF